MQYSSELTIVAMHRKTLTPSAAAGGGVSCVHGQAILLVAGTPSSEGSGLLSQSWHTASQGRTDPGCLVVGEDGQKGECPAQVSLGSAKVMNVPSFSSRHVLSSGLGAQGHDFTSWWPIQNGQSQGSSPPFPLDSHVAKGTPNLMKTRLCFGAWAYHLPFVGWKDPRGVSGTVEGQSSV